MTKNKIKVIYNAYENIIIEKKTFDSNSRLKNILFIGSLYKHKNVISLIEAVKLLLDKKIDVKLNIVGR